jgi:hypothetical protein
MLPVTKAGPELPTDHLPIAPPVAVKRLYGLSYLQRNCGGKEHGLHYWFYVRRLFDLCCRTDAKAVSILSLGVFHPVTKVQSASVHFFLGSDEEKEDSDEETPEVGHNHSHSTVQLWKIHQELDVRTLHHRREINKKTRGGDKKMQKKLNVAKKVIC